MKNEEILEMNKGKKFDIILMNPPYSRSLHLRFLEKVIKIADNVVSVQPVRWLEEATAKFNNKSTQNKYEDSISKHIKDLEIIPIEETKKKFRILLPANIGIYICDKDGGFDYKSISANEIVDKVIEYIKDNKCNFEMNKNDGYRLRVPFISSGKAVGSGDRPPMLTELPIKDIVFKDGKKDGKWWYEYYAKNQHSKTTEEITSSIRFDSEEEAHNFYKSIKTDFGRYIENQIITDVRISDIKILWMGNAKHPRTGTIGYKDAWTNEDFYKFFDVNKEWQNKIENFIKNHEENYNKWMKEHGKKRK